MESTTNVSWSQAQSDLRPLLRTDNRTNIAYLCAEYFWLGLVMWGCTSLYHAWASQELATAGFIPLAIIGTALVAVSQHRLSGLAHDASHYVLFKNRLANELVSDLFLMFPIVAMTQQYRAAHLGHHRFVNDPERDPDLVRLNHPDPHNFPISKLGFWRRYVLRGLWPPSILRYLIGRAKAANLGTPESIELGRTPYPKSVARRMRGAYWLALLTTVHILKLWPVFWIFWVLPLLTFYPLLMQLREIAHHSNTPDDGDLTNSRVFQVNPLWSACVFPYGQAFHLTHHLFAVIPHYRIAEAHRQLLRHQPYRETVQVCNGFFFRKLGTKGPSVLEALAHQSGIPAPKLLNRRAGRGNRATSANQAIG